MALLSARAWQISLPFEWWSGIKGEIFGHLDGRRSVMWRVQDVIVISDLHLSSDEPGQGLFGADEALEQFLLWVVKRTHHCTVVLNGDVLDFLFAESQPGLDADKLERETDAIIERHRAVFNALGKLACSPQHSLIILSGNHDPELLFPTVQMKIKSSPWMNG